MKYNQEPEVLGVILARGGSKGIPRKNLVEVGGIPLVVRAVNSALACPEVSRVVVSTDDEEIAKLARRAGAEVPFMRPEEISGGSVPDLPVLRHAVEWYRENEGWEAEIVLKLLPTLPFRESDDISAAIKLIVETGAEALRSVHEVKRHPYWMKSIDEKTRRLCPFVKGKDEKEYYCRQLLPPAYYINSLVDAISAKRILTADNLFGDDVVPLVINDSRVLFDIDEPIDVFMANAYLQWREENEE